MHRNHAGEWNRNLVQRWSPSWKIAFKFFVGVGGEGSIICQSCLPRATPLEGSKTKKRGQPLTKSFFFFFVMHCFWRTKWSRRWLVAMVTCAGESRVVVARVGAVRSVLVFGVALAARRRDGRRRVYGGGERKRRVK